MILKKCIQSLLKTTLPRSVTHSSGTSQGYGNTVISPINGWMTGVAKGTLTLRGRNNGMQSSCVGGSSTDTSAILPVTKGQEIGVGSDNSLTYKFIETLGGVKRLFAPCFRIVWQEV